MQISELIEFLSQFDGNKEIVIDECEGGYIKIEPEYFEEKDGFLVLIF